MNRRIALVGSMTLGATILLAGCGSAASNGTSAKSKGPVTVVVASWTGTNVTNNIINSQLKYFNKTHPGIHAVYHPISGNYETILKTEFVAGDAPDIITVNNGGQAPVFESQGAVIPLNSYIKKSHFSLTDFYSVHIRLWTCR